MHEKSVDINKFPTADSPADCTAWIIANIKSLDVVRSYLKGVAEGKVSTNHFQAIIDEDLACTALSFMVDGSPFPRSSCTNSLFGSFDVRLFEPAILSLEKLGRKG